jgi:hypothetical protein
LECISEPEPGAELDVRLLAQGAKKGRISSASGSGFSTTGKCPPRGSVLPAT